MGTLWKLLSLLFRLIGFLFPANGLGMVKSKENGDKDRESRPSAEKPAKRSRSTPKPTTEATSTAGGLKTESQPYDQLDVGDNASHPETSMGRLTDDVHLAVITPSVLMPGGVHVLSIWAYLRKYRAQVMEMVHNEVRGQPLIITQGPARVLRGAVLYVSVRIEGVSVEPPAKPLVWDGKSGKTTFALTVPKYCKRGSRHGVAQFYVNGLEIARVDFALKIRSRPTIYTRQLRVRDKRYHSAFASYAHEDQEAVLARVHGLEKAGVNVFLDVLSLRSGDHYEEVLFKMIPRQDVFYLFWSEAASRSKWVDREWRLALKLRGIDYIDPFPLPSSERVAPPPELKAKLHFNDSILPHFGK